MDIRYEHDDDEEFDITSLPSAVEILKTTSSLQHLTIGICFDDYHSKRKLSRYKSLKKLIEEDVLVIHADETAPGNSRFGL